MTSPPPRRAADVVAALADAFDAVAPQQRAAAEQELLDAGLDPRAIAARFTALASPQPGDRRPPRRPIVSGWRWAALAAAVAAVALAAALLTTRTARERLARPAPHVGAAPDGRVAREAGGTAAEPEVVPPAVARRGEQRAAKPPPAATPPTGRGHDGSLHDLIVTVNDGEVIPPGVRELVGDGRITLREVAVDPAAIASLQSTAFTSASAANADRYAIDPDACRLRTAADGSPVRTRFGLPFPRVRPNERAAACEIIWNVEAAFAAGGGRRGRATLCTSANGSDEQCADARFASLAYVGGLLPSVDNPNDLRAALLMRLFGASPAQGAGALVEYPLDSAERVRLRHLPAERTVRSIADGLAWNFDPAFTSLAVGLDDHNCFGGAPESYDWALLGVQEVFAPLSGEGMAISRAPDDASTATAAPDTMTVMRRSAWVVVATGRGALAGPVRSVLWVDTTLYRPYWRVDYIGTRVVAAYACGAGWTADGDVVAPLTSSVTRYDAASGRVDRFLPFDEVLDPRLGRDDFSIRALVDLQP